MLISLWKNNRKLKNLYFIKKKLIIEYIIYHILLIMDSILTYLLHTFTFTKLKALLSVVYSWFAYLIGWFDTMVQGLYVLLMLDFILGFGNAWRTHTISKKKMQLWIVKIIAYSVTLIVIHYADVATLSADIFWLGVRELWVGYLAVNEALSCLKYLTEFWVPLPKWLIVRLESYRDNLNSADFK